MAGEQQPQQQLTPEQQFLTQLAQEMRAGFAQQNAALAQLAQRQQQPAQQQQAAAPKIGVSELEQINVRVLDELGRNPTRVLGEVRAGARDEALQIFRGELQQYDQQRRLAEQGERLSAAILQANPELVKRQDLLANTVDYYQRTAPHLSRDQQIQAAVSYAKQVIAAENNQLIQQYEWNKRAQAQGGYPQPGAYTDESVPTPENEYEARRARLQVYIGGQERAISTTRKTNVG